MPNEQSDQLPQGSQQPEGISTLIDAELIAAAISRNVAAGIQQGITDGLSLIVPAVIDRLTLGMASAPGLLVATTTAELATTTTTTTTAAPKFTVPPARTPRPAEQTALDSSVVAAAGLPLR